jgi:hypothetical protein
MNKKGFASVLVFLILAITFGVLLVAYRLNIASKTSNKSAVSLPETKQEDIIESNGYKTFSDVFTKKVESNVTNMPIPTLITNNPENIVSEVQKYMNKISPLIQFSTESKNTPYDYGPYLWWISNDGWNIIDNSAQEMKYEDELIIGNLKDPVYLCPLNSNSCTRVRLIQVLSKAISDLLSQNGYIKNQLNSSTNEDDKKFYDYIQAYKKGETKCVVSLSGDLPTSLSLTCADQFDNAYQEQTPFLRRLSNDPQSGKYYKNSAISKIQQKNDFVRLDVRGRRGGSYQVMKLISGNWVRLYGGQDFPLCGTVSKLGVPKEIYLQCYDCDSLTSCGLDNLR